MLSVLFILITLLLSALGHWISHLAISHSDLRGVQFRFWTRQAISLPAAVVLILGLLSTWFNDPTRLSTAFRLMSADPAMWVKSRQFTGRIVTVSNSRTFSEPVFNYTRDFPFMWEEMSIPVSFKSDRRRVERILIEAAQRYREDPTAMAAEAKADLHKRFAVDQIELEPGVFLRITENGQGYGPEHERTRHPRHPH